MKKFFLIFFIFIIIILIGGVFYFLYSGINIKDFLSPIVSKDLEISGQIQNEKNNESFFDKDIVLSSVSVYSSNEINVEDTDTLNTLDSENRPTDNFQSNSVYLISDYQITKEGNNYTIDFVKSCGTEINLPLPLPCKLPVIAYMDAYLVPLIDGTILCFDFNKTIIKKIKVPLTAKIKACVGNLFIYGEDGFLYTYDIKNIDSDFENVQTDINDGDIIYNVILPTKTTFDKIIYSVSNFVDISQISFEKIKDLGFLPLVNNQALVPEFNQLTLYTVGIPESGEWTFTFFDEHGFKYNQWGLIGLYDLEGNQLACNVEYTAENASVTYSCSDGEVFYLVVSLMGEKYPGEKLYIGTVKE